MVAGTSDVVEVAEAAADVVTNPRRRGQRTRSGRNGWRGAARSSAGRRPVSRMRFEIPPLALAATARPRRGRRRCDWLAWCQSGEN